MSSRRQFPEANNLNLQATAIIFDPGSVYAAVAKTATDVSWTILSRTRHSLVTANSLLPCQREMWSISRLLHVRLFMTGQHKEEALHLMLDKHQRRWMDKS